jgi:hypothetical protein
MLRRLLARLSAALLIGLFAFTAAGATGCYGDFALTRKLHQWNGSLGDKWVNTLVFWALVIVPVYEVAALGDAIIFNVIEFWGGRNPIHSASAPPSAEIVAGGAIELRRGDHTYRLVPAGARRFALQRDAEVVAYVERAQDGGLRVISAEVPRVQQIDRETLEHLRGHLRATL